MAIRLRKRVGLPPGAILELTRQGVDISPSYCRLMVRGTPVNLVDDPLQSPAPAAHKGFPMDRLFIVLTIGLTLVFAAFLIR